MKTITNLLSNTISLAVIVGSIFVANLAFAQEVIADDSDVTYNSSIRGVNFDWNEEHVQASGGEDGYFVRRHDVGVIAQEVEEVLPEVVAEREDGFKAVRYEKIVPLLIEAIKELKSELESVKNNCKCSQ